MHNFINYIKKCNREYPNQTFYNEDSPILNFFKKLPKDKTFNYLEVGSGLGRFARIINNRFSHFIVTCIEINNELARATRAEGLETKSQSILDNDFKSEEFDLI